jgi:hypothetical protein
MSVRELDPFIKQPFASCVALGPPPPAPLAERGRRGCEGGCMSGAALGVRAEAGRWRER